MNGDALLTIFVAVNALTSTGTLLAVFHLWRRAKDGQRKPEVLATEEEEVLEKNLNTRLRDLQTTRFSRKFSNLPDGSPGRK